MLVENLGRTRAMLLESFKDLTNEQLNQKPKSGKLSIAQILYHLYQSEKELAVLVLQSLRVRSGNGFPSLTHGSEQTETTFKNFLTKRDVIHFLDDSRFKYVQAIFNEIHERDLDEKSIDHPVLGVVNLKPALDSIWEHERHHIYQINEIKQELLDKEN